MASSFTWRIDTSAATVATPTRRSTTRRFRAHSSMMRETKR